MYDPSISTTLASNSEDRFSTDLEEPDGWSAQELIALLIIMAMLTIIAIVRGIVDAKTVS